MDVLRDVRMPSTETGDKKKSARRRPRRQNDWLRQELTLLHDRMRDLRRRQAEEELLTQTAVPSPGPPGPQGPQGPASEGEGEWWPQASDRGGRPP